MIRMKYVIVVLLSSCFVSCSTTQQNNISVLTYNVLGTETNTETRHPQLIKLLKKYNPTIICLQESSYSFIKKLEESGLLDEYNLPREDGNILYTRGLYILSKIPISKYYMSPLPSRQGRSLLYIDIYVDHTLLRIATCHLESPLESNKERLEQLNFYRKYLNGITDTIFAGDFNFV